MPDPVDVVIFLIGFFCGAAWLAAVAFRRF